MKRLTASERAERKTVADYPSDHNPYLPHELEAGCFKVCQAQAVIKGWLDNDARPWPRFGEDWR